MIGKIKKFLLAAVLSVAVLGFSPKANAQATIIQYVASDVNDSISESSSTSATAQFNSNTKAGRLLVAFCFGENASGPGVPSGSFPPPANIPVCSTPTTPGLTWTPITQEGVLGGFGPLQPTELFSVGYTVAVYYVANAPSISSSVVTTELLTGGFSCSCAEAEVAQQIILFELGGMATSNVVDTYAGATGPYTENPQTSPLVTTKTDFVLSAFQSSNTLWDYPTYGAGPGYTEFLDTTDTATCEDVYDTPTCYWSVQYISNAPSGTIPTAWGNVGMTPGDSWASVAVAFKTAATPPTPPPLCKESACFTQPWETTEGEISLDTLNVDLNIPIVDKDGVGLPFSFGLHFDNNFWYPGSCGNPNTGSACWQPNTNHWGWMPDAAQMYGVFIAVPYTCPDPSANPPNSVGWAVLDFYAYQDPQGNIHPIDSANQAVSFSGNACSLPATSTVVSNDGSGYTYKLAFPTNGQSFSNIYESIPITGTGTPQVVTSNGTVITPGIIYYNNPGALGQ